MARDRADRRWAEAEAPWQRLIWARQSDGRYTNPTSFAKAIDVAPHTYAKYERDPAGPNSAKWNADRARQFAAQLDIRWEWLLWGELEPWIENDKADQPLEATEAAEIISGEGDPAERRRMVDMLRLMKRTGTEG